MRFFFIPIPHLQYRKDDDIIFFFVLILYENTQKNIKRENVIDILINHLNMHIYKLFVYFYQHRYSYRYV